MANRKQYQTQFLLGAKVQASFGKAFGLANKNLSHMQKQASLTQKAFSGMGGALKTAVGFAGAYVGFRAVEGAFNKTAGAAGEFSDQMANVATLIDNDVEAKIAKLGPIVQKTAILTGQGTDVMTDGLYQVISAFGDTAEAGKQLEISAKAAKAGNATVVDSVNLLSAVTKGYGDTSAKAMKQASDLAFQTVKLGQTTFPELAASMGKVIPLSATLGVKQQELFGAMATLTGVTGNTAEVTTQLRATMQGFLQPTTNMQTALKRLGYANGQAALQSESLGSILGKLKALVNGNEIAFANLFGSVEAKNAVLALTGAQAENFVTKTKAMNEAIGATDEAFRKKQATFKSMTAQIKQMGNVLAINIGNKILPSITKNMEKAMPYMMKFIDNFDSIYSQIGKFSNELLTANPILLVVSKNIGWLKDIAVTTFRNIAEVVKGDLPVFNQFSTDIQKNLVGAFEAVKPVIEWIFTEGLPQVVSILGDIVGKASDVYNFISQNWNGIEPIVYGIASAMVAYKVAMLGVVASQKAAMIIEGLSKAWKVGSAVLMMFQSGASLATVAQWALNAAMSANPIGVVVVAIGALVAAGVALYKNWDTISKFLLGIWNVIKVGAINIFNSVTKFLQTWGIDLLGILLLPFDGAVILIIKHWDKIKEGALVLKEELKSIFSNVAEYLGGVFKTPINAVISLINGVLGEVNKIKLDVPDWVPVIGGKQFSANIPKIPMLAKGTNNFSGGPAIVGEKGPELVNLRRGSQVIPNNRTERLLNNYSNVSNQNSDIIFAPNYIIQGNADKDTIVEANRLSFSEFKQFMNMYKQEKSRLSFAGGRA